MRIHSRLARLERTAQTHAAVSVTPEQRETQCLLGVIMGDPEAHTLAGTVVRLTPEVELDPGFDLLGACRTRPALGEAVAALDRRLQTLTAER